MADGVYNNFYEQLMSGNIDLAGGTIRVMLVDDYTFNDEDGFQDDIADEISGTGYTAGGVALASKTVTQDDTNGRGVFDADDAQWTGAIFMADGAVIYLDTGGAESTNPLIGYSDFGGSKAVSAGTFTIQWDSVGILTVG